MRSILLGTAILMCAGVFGQEASTFNTGLLRVAPETLMSIEGDFVNKESADYGNDGEVLLRGDFVNNGLAGYELEGGLTRFEGLKIQEISGEVPATYYNVLFDNQSDAVPFHLSGMMTIDGGASFFNGIVDNKHYAGVFEMNTEGYHINTEDVSYVEGPVNRIGNIEFVYPIGKDGYYSPAMMASLTNPEAYFEGEFFLENSDTEETPHQFKPDGVLRIDDQEYWNLESVEGEVGEQPVIGLSYREETTPQFIIDAIHNDLVTIVRWDEEKHLWIDEGGTLDSETGMITTAVDGLGWFTFATLDEAVLNECHVIVYNAVTPNGDGINDYFRVDSQGDCAMQLRVKIYNRWGVKVFESDDYGRAMNGDVFDGYSHGRATIKSSNQLPTGTYFYVLEYDYQTGTSEGLETKRKAGYLYLSTDSGN